MELENIKKQYYCSKEVLYLYSHFTNCTLLKMKSTYYIYQLIMKNINLPVATIQVYYLYKQIYEQYTVGKSEQWVCSLKNGGRTYTYNAN